MSWICSRCETENPDTLKVCEVCGGERIEEPPKPPTPKPKPKPKPDSTLQPPPPPPDPSPVWRIFAIIIVIVFIVALIAKCAAGKSSPRLVTNKTITIALGTCSYSGPVDSIGMPNGKGEAHFDDGRIYKGNFVHGNAEDNGEAFFEGLDGTFEGSFKDNKFDKGKAIDANTEARFEGEFKNGEPFNGNLYEKDKYVGKIENGKVK